MIPPLRVAVSMAVIALAIVLGVEAARSSVVAGPDGRLALSGLVAILAGFAPVAVGLGMLAAQVRDERRRREEHRDWLDTLDMDGRVQARKIESHGERLEAIESTLGKASGAGAECLAKIEKHLGDLDTLGVKLAETALAAARNSVTVDGRLKALEASGFQPSRGATSNTPPAKCTDTPAIFGLPTRCPFCLKSYLALGGSLPGGLDQVVCRDGACGRVLGSANAWEQGQGVFMPNAEAMEAFRKHGWTDTMKRLGVKP